MDNPNDPNSTNNPNPVPQDSTSPLSPPPQIPPQDQTPSWTPPAPSTPSTPAAPPLSNLPDITSPANPSPSPWAETPVSTPPTSTPPLNPWVNNTPATPIQPPIESGQSPLQTPDIPQPVPVNPDLTWPNTFAQQTPTPQPPNPPVNTSPLDNPWGAPVQPPPLEVQAQPATSPQPTWTPSPVNQNPATDPVETSISPSSGIEPATIQPEPAPTDLSHLISGTQSEISQPPVSDPETLVVPSTTPDVPTLPAEGGSKGIPKWLIGLGIGLLIVVAGASAYFILGIGQPSKTTTSIPAVEQPRQTVKAPAPIITPVPLPTQAPASGSANFGDFQSGQPATSAADLIRQKQQQGR